MARLDEASADAQSAQRVIAALRREQHARDGRPIAACWGHLADRIERDFRPEEGNH